MSESDTMFNERDRRCAAVQLMLSTDPNYDNRTIATTLKMQIRTFQHLRAQLNASVDPLQVVERKDTARKTWSKDFIEKVQATIDDPPPSGLFGRLPEIRRLTPNCECMCEGGLEVFVLQAPDKPNPDSEDKELQANQVNQTPSSPDLNQLDYLVWSYVENVTNMTWQNTKACLITDIRRVFVELPPALVEKACFQFRIRIEAVI